MRYIKISSVAMQIDINRSRRMNRYKEKTLDHTILPTEFPAMVCNVLDILDMCIQVKKYTDETVTLIDSETELLNLFVELYLKNKERASSLLPEPKWAESNTYQGTMPSE